MGCYCVARNKPIRRKITKLQTATVISLAPKLTEIHADIRTVTYKAYHEKLPDFFYDHIISRRNVGYTLRTPDSLSIPPFNTSYMNDSLTHRGNLRFLQYKCKFLILNILFLILIPLFRTNCNFHKTLTCWYLGQTTSQLNSFEN